MPPVSGTDGGACPWLCICSWTLGAPWWCVSCSSWPGALPASSRLRRPSAWPHVRRAPRW